MWPRAHCSRAHVLPENDTKALTARAAPQPPHLLRHSRQGEDPSPPKSPPQSSAVGGQGVPLLSSETSRSCCPPACDWASSPPVGGDRDQCGQCLGVPTGHQPGQPSLSLRPGLTTEVPRGVLGQAWHLPPLPRCPARPALLGPSSCVSTGVGLLVTCLRDGGLESSHLRQRQIFLSTAMKRILGGAFSELGEHESFQNHFCSF